MHASELNIARVITCVIDTHNIKVSVQEKEYVEQRSLKDKWNGFEVVSVLIRGGGLVNGGNYLIKFD